MAHNNQNLVLDNSETAQFLELQNELNKDGSKRSLSQVVDYALRVAMANAKATPNAGFRDKEVHHQSSMQNISCLRIEVHQETIDQKPYSAHKLRPIVMKPSRNQIDNP